MNEEHVGEALLGFHLGAIEDAQRAWVEGHLLGCRPCLSDFLALKRRFDSATAFDERPSPAVRDRLRADVRNRLARPFKRPGVWAFGAAVAAALLILLWFGTHRVTGHTTPETLIDTGEEAQATLVL